MTAQIRPYRKKRRAEMEAQTATRITLAAVELHGSVGPSQTSMSSVARLAGVRRSTLYRHFSDEAALFQACTGHFMAEHPLPDLGRWATISDTNERLGSGLAELYAYYGQTEQMLSNVLRDESTVPIVRDMLADYRGYIAAARETLLRGRRDGAVAGRGVDASVGHALAFATWRSLVQDEGLGVDDAVGLMCCLVAAAAGRRAKIKRRRA